MKLSLAQEMRDIDRAAIDGYGIPEIVLMENASREIAKAMDYKAARLYGIGPDEMAKMQMRWQKNYHSGWYWK